MLEIRRLKCLLGTVQQNSQILTVDAEVAADFILVALFDKDFAQQPAVTLGKLLQDRFDFFFGLLGDKRAQKIEFESREAVLVLVVERGIAPARSVVFEQDVVADGIHKRTQALGLKNFSIAQGNEEAREGFLAYIFHGFGRFQARAELDFDERAEVSGKMLLGAKVPRSQATDIGVIKGLEAQEGAPSVEWDKV
jgi:hypothetical protein